MHKINDIVKREIFNPSIDLTADYSSLLIDNFVKDNSILEEIPLLKTIVAGTNIGLAIKERFFVKKFLNFLTEFHNGDLNERDLTEFKWKMDSKPNYKDKVIETLVIMIDRHSIVNQSKIMANLFISHIKEDIDWNRFNALCIVLEKLHPHSYQTLYDMSLNSDDNLSRSYWGSARSGGHPDDRNIYRLNQEDEALLISSGLISPEGSNYIVSPLGRDIFKYGILPLFV
ncbi:hypothetical protein [Priestia megaterium]|uniref:hypothetical protein n=1 Tax=Priestia megaterium TaxID=1404 RepID=UPI002E24263F|nr:hypothetical protein [Priestia megaterium]